MASLKPEWNDTQRYLAGYWSFHKNGNPKYWHEHDVTWLRKCDHCGLIGTPKKIAYRSALSEPRWGVLGCDIELCMACRNKFTSLVKMVRARDECRYLINKLVRLANAGCVP